MSAVPSVPDLLRRGALAPASVSAVDAVVGEDWAYLELGRGAAARLAIDEGRRTGARRRAAIGGALAPNPQALVKLIGSGGTGTARGLKAQMSYLSRQGDVPLVSSESTFGTELGANDAEELAAAWGLPEADRGGADRTSHFVVSFPQGIDPAAAERAGRAWAAELFDSGVYGDRWDYYTAFHTDTAYPHIHVVVGRRGLDEGRWLRISGRSEITFDRLREVQVEVAAREGIALTGTSRLARGVHDRPVPDAEYRRAKAEGREAVAPAHTEASAIVTATEILEYARDYQGASAALREEAPALADRLEAAAETILAGRALAVERETAPGLTPEEVMRMAETIEQVRAEVRENFVTLEADIRGVAEPAKRAEFLRDLAALKAEAAPLIRDDLGLQGYRSESAHADYRGLVVPAGDARAAAIRAEADREVARLAERLGLQPDATLVRFGGEVVSVGLGRDYRAEELAERAADRAARGEPARSGSTRRLRSSPSSTAGPGRSTGRRRSDCASWSGGTRVSSERSVPTAARLADGPSAGQGRAIRCQTPGGPRPRRLGGTSRRPIAPILAGLSGGGAIGTTTIGAGDDATATGHPARRRRRAHGRHPARAAGSGRGPHLAARGRPHPDRSHDLVPTAAGSLGPAGVALAFMLAGVALLWRPALSLHGTARWAEHADTYVLAHAYTERAIAHAVANGVRSVEHGNFLDDATATQMAEKKAFLVPTLVAYETMWNEGLEVGMPPELHAKIRPVLDVGTTSLEVAARHGVRMAYGTDLIGPLHRHQSLEFRIRREALPAIEVIRQATLYAAELFNMTGEIGAVEDGLRADLVAVDGNPVEDIELLMGQGEHLPLIMKDGHVEKNLLN